VQKEVIEVPVLSDVIRNIGVPLSLVTPAVREGRRQGPGICEPGQHGHEEQQAGLHVPMLN
jgi:hypothetical protein